MAKNLKKCALCGGSRQELAPELEMKDGRKIPVCVLCLKNIFKAFVRVWTGKNVYPPILPNY